MPIIDLNSFYVSRKNNFIFTDIDLDGAMSCLLFQWISGRRTPYIATRVTDFRASFANWLKNNKLSSFHNVYILDLDVSNECLELVDKPNIVIIDHHDSHERNKHKYKHAKTFIQSTTSCSKLIYKLLHTQSKIKLTDNHKRLILLVDDYDSYTLQVPGSHELNSIYWNYQGNKVGKFMEQFESGFHGYTSDQKNIIQFYKNKIINVTSGLNVYEADVPFGKNVFRVVSTFADSCINDVADFIIKTHSADIGIVVNEKSNKVSFRKNKACTADLSVLASTIAGGGGHEYASGGSICDKFALFSKLFKPIL